MKLRIPRSKPNDGSTVYDVPIGGPNVVSGLDASGLSDVTPVLVSAFSQGGDWYVPEGDYLVAGTGPDSGGVLVTLLSSIRVTCHPNARFFTDNLDNDMIRFVVPSDGSGLPVQKITFDWWGGFFDTENQKNSTVVPFDVLYPPANPGTSATCDGLSIRGLYNDGVSKNAFSRVTVKSLRVFAGVHWEFAGGDSGVFVNGADFIDVGEDCEFHGCRDLGIYTSGETIAGALDIHDGHCINCFFGVSAKRGLDGFGVHNFTFDGCVAAIQANEITASTDSGVISQNNFRNCSYFIRLQSSTHIKSHDNNCISLGAYLADGITPVSPYAGGASVGFLLDGAKDCMVHDERCDTLNVNHSGKLARLEVDGATIAERNIISNVFSTDFDRVVEEVAGGADDNRIELCYNFGTLGLRDPVTVGASTSVIRWVPGVGTPGRWSYESGALFGDGTNAAPSIARRAAPGVGFYFTAATVHCVSATEELWIATNTEFTLNNNILVPVGSAASPAYSFSSDPDIGIYRVGTNRLGASANGVRRQEWNSVNGSELALLGGTLTPTNNGDMVFELTSNTLLTIRVKGSDGTTRSATIVLA